MKKTDNNIYILLAYVIIQIVAIIAMAIVALFNPEIIDNMTVFIEYSAYVNLFVMLGAFLFFVIVYRSYFKFQFTEYYRDLLRKILFTGAAFIVLFFASIVSAIIMDLLNVGGTSVNQEALNAVADSTLYAKISLVIFTVILAPVIEEFVFRKAVFGLFWKSKPIVPIILSGVIFGFIHVLADPNLIQVIPYLISGCTLAFMFYVSDKNLLVVIGAHSAYNLLGVIIMLLPEEVLEGATELATLFI